MAAAGGSWKGGAFVPAKGYTLSPRERRSGAFGYDGKQYRKVTVSHQSGTTRTFEYQRPDGSWSEVLNYGIRKRLDRAMGGG